MNWLSSLTTAEIQAIASALATSTPPPPPATLDGPTLYANDCADCHGPVATSTKAGRTADQIAAAIAGVTAMKTSTLTALTAAEIQAIAEALATSAGGGGPDYSDCTACHGQPPSGTAYPNVAGAHAVHNTLASVNNDCAVCHTNHDHNGTVDLQLASAYDAKSGAATPNSNNTCSSVKCHGGQTTPNWQSGTIAVNTQCTSCHASGTSQYNSYFSGQHSRHISRGYSCTVCHNTTKLATGHFSNLATNSFEQDPAATIGGSSTSVGSYSPSASNPSSGTCSSVSCHGSRSW